MAHYTTTVTTPWNPDDAFAYMADLRNFEQWDPGVSSADLVVGDEPGLKAEYDLRASGMTLRYKTLEFDSPRRVVVEAQSRLLRSYDVIEVTPAASGIGAVVRYGATLELKGVLKLADPILGLAFNRIGDRAATGLQRALNPERAA